ncbi:protein translocase subunit SecD [Mastigocoleus sp. MO_188.B34]|uniref:protein translocase subunit SecD n=1 Tax=Mastigocoleus sp. MO_188.B34 TaxID=3036635 RepID=UPI00261E2A45|nr:protein translocase subunit SecD [Mastigocoleus sp. MO_188.B34]MDJ0695242.1 protein translocase subunit SecD [Mastigocoleus sp. MO_188.B34]
MQRQKPLLILIFVLVFAAIAVLVNFNVPLGLDLRGGSQLTIQVKTTEKITQVSEQDLEAVQTVLGNRVNGLGVSEPVIQSVGNNQILIQLPGVDDPKSAERVLGTTAQLEFRRENPEKIRLLTVRQEELRELLTKQQDLQKKEDTAAIEANQAKIAEKQKQILEEQEKLFEKTELTGEYLTDAIEEPLRAGGAWAVAIRFNNRGGQLFADLSREAAQNSTRLGIFLDDRLISAPSVGSEYRDTGITGGSAQISGSFDSNSAKELALQLRGGSLPLPIEIVENRTVGATLGQDSIRSSIFAGLSGLALVLVFMVLYYRLPGLIANIALIIYALLTWACFALLGVTLTLPGIAGFILSIGMAVDANVLIFERTREELRSGKSLYRSVESGFYRAFSSILDSNVTTLIACLALFVLGAGFVKGFALTLAIGVLVSMFTAVTCSRTLMFLAITIPSLRKPEIFCPNIPSSKKAEVA